MLSVLTRRNVDETFVKLVNEELEAIRESD